MLAACGRAGATIIERVIVAVMHFRSRFDISRVEVDFRTPPSNWSVPGEMPVTVSIDCRTCSSDNQSREIVCWAHMDWTPPRKAGAAFEALSDRRLPDGADWNEERYGKEPFFLTPEGDLRGPGAPHDVLPPSLQTVITRVHKRLYESALRVVELLRWRIADDGPHFPLGDAKHEWSLDGIEWFALPIAVEVHQSAKALPAVLDVVREDVQRLLDQDAEAPLSLELWREAWDQRTSNPRSAVLIGVSALEVGVKQYVVARAPQTKWLMGNIPSPPLEKLLSEYLPQLGLGSEIREELPRVREAAEYRNNIAHTGSAPRLDRKRVERILTTVRAVLRALDRQVAPEWTTDPEGRVRGIPWATWTKPGYKWPLTL